MCKHFQRIISYILVSTMLLTLLPTAVFALEVDNSDGAVSSKTISILEELPNEENMETQTPETTGTTQITPIASIEEDVTESQGPNATSQEFIVEIKNYNGTETLGSLHVTSNSKISSSEIEELTASNDLLRTGFEFAGWSTHMGNVDINFITPEYFEISKDTTIYAVYRPTNYIAAEETIPQELDSLIEKIGGYTTPYEDLNALISQAIQIKQSAPMTVVEEDPEYQNEISERIELANSTFNELQLEFPKTISELSDEEMPLFTEVHFTGGNGVENDPFIISTIDDLHEIKTVTEGGVVAYYKLENDIDLSGIPWTPIGNSDTPFSGHLDGNGHAILNLAIEGTDIRTGLFGTAKDATVDNLTIQNASVHGPSIVGTLFGQGFSSTVSNITLKNCSVEGGSFIGGLAGAFTASTVSGCSSDGYVLSHGSNTGGIVGFFDGTIENAIFTGTVEGEDCTAGIIGNLYGDAYSCTNTGSITGTKTIGGIAGQLSYTGSSHSIQRCLNTGDLQGTDEVGGIAAYALCSGDYPQGATLVSVANTGSIHASNNYAGGIIADMACSTFLVTAYNIGDVSADNATCGGLVGRYNFSNRYISGMSGVYNAGEIHAGSQGAALIGCSYITTITNSYYLIDRQPTLPAIAYNRTEGTRRYEGKDTVTLRGMASTLHATRFATDEDLINNGFPYLVDINYTLTQDPHHGQFKFPCTYADYDIISDYYYYDEYFAQSSYTYNEHLASMSLCLALSAFSSSEVEPVVNTISAEIQEEPVGEVNVKNLLEKLGYTDFQMKDYDVETDTHTIGIATAHKKVEVNGETAYIIAIALRGGEYYHEWAGNVEIGESGDHSGFTEAKNQVIEFISEKYIREYDSPTNIKFWITGFSRAAATANLVAGALDNGALSIQNCNYGPEDIYAYTFETPRGLLEGSLNDEKYDNIFNIVNGYDIVPRVAPAAWGFSWYGVEKNLPTLTNSGEDYAELLSRMLPHYESLPLPQVEAAEYSVGLISLRTLTECIADYVAGLVSLPITISDSGTIPQDIFYDEYINGIATEVLKDRGNYVENYQEGLKNTLYIALGPEVEKEQFCNAVLNKLRSSLPEIGLVLQIGFSPSIVENDEELLQKINQGLRPIFERIVTESASEVNVTMTVEELDAFADALIILLKDLLKQYSTETVSLIYEIGKLKQAHAPEVCLAWMQSMDSHYAENASQTTSFAHGGYRIIRVNGNARVTLKGNDGNVISSFTDDSLNPDGNLIFAQTNSDGDKLLYLPAARPYTVEIDSCDGSQISCWIAEYNPMYNAITRIVEFEPVECDSEECLVCVVPAWSQPLNRSMAYSQVSFTLTDHDSQPIAIATEVTGVAAQARYSVSLSADGTGVGRLSGAGVRRYGTYAKVWAQPDAGSMFVGWYSNGVLVSEEAIYQFKVVNDVDLTARFEILSAR